MTTDIILKTPIGDITCRLRERDPEGREAVPTRPWMPTFTFPGGRLYDALELRDIVQRNGWKVAPR